MMQSLRCNLRLGLIYWKVMFHFQDTQFFVLQTIPATSKIVGSLQVFAHKLKNILNIF